MRNDTDTLDHTTLVEPLPMDPSIPTVVDSKPLDEISVASLSEPEWFNHAQASLRGNKRSSLIIILLTFSIVIGVMYLQTQRNIISVLSPTSIESSDPIVSMRLSVKNYDDFVESITMISSYRDAASIAKIRISDKIKKISNSKSTINFSEFKSIYDNLTVWRTSRTGGRGGSSIITASGGGYSIQPNGARIYTPSISIFNLYLNTVTKRMDNESITIRSFQFTITPPITNESIISESIIESIFKNLTVDEQIEMLTSISEKISRVSDDLLQIGSKIDEISMTLREDILSQISHFNYVIFLRGAFPITLLFLMAASGVAVLIRQIHFLNRISETEMAFLYAQSSRNDKIRSYQDIVGTFSPSRRTQAEEKASAPGKEMISGVLEAVKGLTEVLKK